MEGGSAAKSAFTTAMFPDVSPYVLDGKPLSEYPTDIVESVPFVTSPRVCVLDGDGNVLFGKNIHEQAKIASVTKVMTALVASDFPMDTRMHVSVSAATTPGSFAGIVEGDECDLYEMIDGLMLPSGNDAAYAIAENLGRKMLVRDGRTAEAGDVQSCVARFVDEMNNKAFALGMTDTLFVNPCGLDDEGFEGEHVSSAYDVALMMRAASKTYPVSEIMAKKEDVLSCTRNGVPCEIPLSNTNAILSMEDNALGEKTGFTDAAGRCVATNFVGDDGQTYSIAVLGSASSEMSFSESVTLFRWADTSIITSNPFGDKAKGDEAVVADARASGHLGKTFMAGTRNAGDFVYQRRYWEPKCKLEVEASEPAPSSVSFGEPVGKMFLVGADGTVLVEQPLVALEGVDEPSFAEKYAADVLSWLGKLVRGR